MKASRIIGSFDINFYAAVRLHCEKNVNILLQKEGRRGGALLFRGLSAKMYFGFVWMHV